MSKYPSAKKLADEIPSGSFFDAYEGYLKKGKVKKGRESFFRCMGTFFDGVPSSAMFAEAFYQLYKLRGQLVDNDD